MKSLQCYLLQVRVFQEELVSRAKKVIQKKIDICSLLLVVREAVHEGMAAVGDCLELQKASSVYLAPVNFSHVRLNFCMHAFVRWHAIFD